MDEEWKEQKVAHAGCRIENADREQHTETAATFALNLDLLVKRNERGIIRYEYKESSPDENPEKAHEADHCSPPHHGQQKSSDCRKGSFSQVSGKIVDAQCPARF
jgi:hypothetical protein